MGLAGCKSTTEPVPEKQASDCGAAVAASTAVGSGAAAVLAGNQHKHRGGLWSLHFQKQRTATLSLILL